MDEGFSSIPHWVQELNKIKNIIEFRWTENIGPYRKLIPALREASIDEIIIYADDDTLYQRDWLKLLLEKFLENNERKVIASRVREKRKNLFNLHKTYMLWPIATTEKEFNKDFLITGVGGAILKRSHFNENLIYNDDFLNICPKADDFWISELLEKSGSCVISHPQAMKEMLFIEHSQGLVGENTLNARSIINKIINKIKVYTAGSLGASLCNNDKVQKELSKYTLESSS